MHSQCRDSPGEKIRKSVLKQRDRREKRASQFVTWILRLSSVRFHDPSLKDPVWERPLSWASVRTGDAWLHFNHQHGTWQSSEGVVKVQRDAMNDEERHTRETRLTPQTNIHEYSSTSLVFLRHTWVLILLYASRKWCGPRACRVSGAVLQYKC